MNGKVHAVQEAGLDSAIAAPADSWSEEPSCEPRTEPREAVLLRVLAALDRAGVPYWVIDGYGEAAFDPCDVDCVVPADVLPRRLAHVLHAEADRIGADVIKWREDHHVVLATRTVGSEIPQFLNMHFRPDFRRVGRYFYSGAEVLAGRGGGSPDQAREAWVPGTAVEFGCYLLEKIGKRCLDPAKGRTLEEAYVRDPGGCERQVRRFWGPGSAALILDAVRTGNWAAVQRDLPRLRAELRRRAALRRPLWTAGYFLRKVWLKCVRARWRPGSGMHVVLLGPDGVGKTAVQEAILRSSRTGFSEVHGRSFAPAPWGRPRRSLGKPHALPGRSLPTSLLKAAWWFYYYTVGYYFTVYPAVSRSALYLNHRYIVDSLVDARRYRYRGPRWILRLICWAAPRPDLVVLLDAPPEVVQARKQEVPLEETARACAAYRELVRALPNGRIIDATPPVEQVVAEVVRTIQQLRIARTARRFGLE